MAYRDGLHTGEAVTLRVRYHAEEPIDRPVFGLAIFNLEGVLVTGPKGMVKVRIVDLCPGCAFGGLDLSEQAFGAIAALSAGRVKITWYVVPC